jgi:hypothetical protein
MLLPNKDFHLQVPIKHLLVSTEPFNDNLSNSDHIALNDQVARIMDWNGCGSYQSWPNLRHHPGRTNKNQRKEALLPGDFAMSDGVSLLKTSGTMAELELVHSP